MDSKIGPHIVREEGDVVSIRVIGDLEAVHMQRLLEMIEGIIQRYGRYGTLIDTRQMTRLSPDTRKLVTEFKGASSCFGNAIFGDNLATRVVMTMAWRAIQLLNSQKFHAAFLKNEAEARAWLAARREASTSSKSAG